MECRHVLVYCTSLHLKSLISKHDINIQYVQYSTTCKITNIALLILQATYANNIKNYVYEKHYET